MSPPQVSEAEKSPIRFFLFFSFCLQLQSCCCELRYHYSSFPCPSACVVSGLPQVKHAGPWPFDLCPLKVTECVYLSCSSITRRSWTCLTAHAIQRLEAGSPTLRSMRMGAEGSTPQEWPHGWSAQRRRSAICPLRPRPALLSTGVIWITIDSFLFLKKYLWYNCARFISAHHSKKI